MTQLIKYMGQVYRRAEQDYYLSLELLCADDFGAWYREEKDSEAAQLYRDTLGRQRKVARRLGRSGVHVDLVASDDRYSKHYDAYVRFNWSQFDVVVTALAEVGIPGDILDVPEDFPDDLVAKVTQTTGWKVIKAS